MSNKVEGDDAELLVRFKRNRSDARYLEQSDEWNLKGQPFREDIAALVEEYNIDMSPSVFTLPSLMSYRCVTESNTKVSSPSMANSMD